MFVGYEFERDFADKACTLEYVMSQVGAGMGVYVFLQLSEVSDFAEMAQQYKGHVVWLLRILLPWNSSGTVLPWYSVIMRDKST